MDWKILTVFFAQILGLSTVSGSCYYNSYTTSYSCYYDYYDYYNNYDYYYYYYYSSYRLSAGAILGIIFGALAGLATLIGLIVCLCVYVCKKATPRQGTVIYYNTNPNAGTTVLQTNQTPMQPYIQQGFYSPYPVQMQATGQGVAASFASPPQYSPPQQSTENQVPPPK